MTGLAPSGTAAVDPRYPIGKFAPPKNFSAADRNASIGTIADAPAALRAAVKGLSDQQLDTPYRDGGWTVRQVVHHVPDSHMNAFIRFKLAMTEENPAIKTYEEQLWADLPDVRDTPIEVSLSLLESLHKRWVILLRGMKESDYSRAFKHPQWDLITLDRTLALYAWHSRHHVAHITELWKAKGW